MTTKSGIRGVRELTHFTIVQERVVRVLALVSLAYGLTWLWWRWTETLNPDALAFSVVLVSAETWGWISAAFFLFGAWRMPRRPQRQAPPGKTVDVFVTAYDEPLEVIRRTALGARAIRYPHRTYILDDGKRDELKRVAEDLGIGYIRRAGNANAKAGNLNFAISVTSGEFILQLDADHVPMPNIIDAILGEFDDPAVAFVQTPQDFYNTDSFTHVVNEAERELWEENRIFYSMLQPGKDSWNASFFCGCGGMLRRSAIQSIGGFSTHTIIEDMETSIVLHSRGWKSVYYQSAVAFGLSPGSAAAFHVQRQRWAMGSMQMLRKFNPLFLPGLTPAQRASYLAANLYPFDGLQKLIFYLTPIVFLFSGVVPISASGSEILLRLAPYLLLSVFAFELLSRGTGRLFISERYMMAKFFTYVVSIAALFTSKRLKFNVTPKGTTDVPFRTYAPQAAILVLSVLALAWAPVAHAMGWVQYSTQSFTLSYAATGLWAGWNIYFAAHVVRLCLRMKQQRADHRFAENLVARMVSLGDETELNGVVSVHDLNPLGVAFRTTTALVPNQRVALELPLSPRTVRAEGSIVHVQPVDTRHGRVFHHGLRFEGLGIEDRDAIELHCTHESVPIWRKKYRQSLDLFARASEIVHNARLKRRDLVQLAAQLNVRGADDQSENMTGLLEELSATGARVSVDRPLAPGTLVRFEVPGTTLHGEGQVIFTHALESPMRTRFSVGIRLTVADAPRRRWGLSTRKPQPLLTARAIDQNARVMQQ